MGIDRKIRMVLVKNDFTDVLDKHMRRATSKRDRFDIAASALFVAAGYLGEAAGSQKEDDALTIAATLLRENKIR